MKRFPVGVLLVLVAVAGREQSYQVRGMSGNEHVCVIGFTSASRSHDDIARLMERFLADPFARSPGAR